LLQFSSHYQTSPILYDFINKITALPQRIIFIVKQSGKNSMNLT